jgi:hypothetical protein
VSLVVGLLSWIAFIVVVSATTSTDTTYMPAP